ncbi:MAG: hypothetical protein ACYS91_19490 [Planctomycetota bacterium]|jgi:hypothetical protein
MTELQYHKMSERLGKLEKQNRIMKQIGCVTILIMVVLLTVGSDKNRELDVYSISAQRLTIKDNKGNPGIVMFNDDNGPALTMSDPNNRIRLKMDTTDRGAELSLYDAGFKKQLAISADNKLSGLTLYADSGEIASLRYIPMGGSGLVFYDHNLTRRMLLAATDKESYLRIDNSKGDKQVRLGSQLEPKNPNMIESYGAYMKLYNIRGVPVVKLHADKYGNGVVGAFNQLGAGNELKSYPSIIK